MLNLEKAIKEALENYETRLNLEHERAETWKTIALEASRKLVEVEKELQASKIIISNLKSRYGCETCPGLPKLDNPEVVRMAFEAVYRDKLSDPSTKEFYPAPKHQRPIRFEELIYGK